jgi:uncharacterized membrane protein
MANVIVLTFDTPDEAGHLRQTLGELEGEGRLELDDAAVVVKDARGRVRVRGGTRWWGKLGAVGGGILGAVVFARFSAGADVDDALGALRSYQGTVYRTSLGPDQEEALRQSLRARQLS